MRIMALAYTPPGVNVQEVSSPSVTPLLAIPATVCLVGLSTGYVQKTEVLTLNGTTAAPLTGIPANGTIAATGVVLVMNATNPSDAPSGYTVATAASSSVQIVLDTTAKTLVRNPTATTPVPDGSAVYVSYQYTPADYFIPIRLDNLADVEARFGYAWNTTGTGINSALSHAAGIALENGAQSVVVQPVFFTNAGVRTQ